MTATPLLYLDDVGIHVKLEGENPSGSIKDRFAEHIIAHAVQRGELQSGMTIVETSSGNSAIALARVGAEQGYLTEFFVPTTMSTSDRARLAQYGAKMHFISPDDPTRPLAQIEDLCKTGGYFWPCQYFNPHAPSSYHGLAREISEELDGKDISELVCAVGTGATITGLCDVLCISHPFLHTVAVVAEHGNSISGLRPLGASITYKAEKDIYDPARPRQTIPVTANQAQQGRDALLSFGILAGVASGAAFFAACTAAKDAVSTLGRNRVVILGDGKIRM